MTRRTALNPEGTGFKFGENVRVERGLSRDSDGKVHRGDDAKPLWIVARKVDCSDDEDTTYDYRFEEVQCFPEDEPGEMPDAAVTLAEKLASGRD